MAIKGAKIDYTVYPANYHPGDGCWDLRTLESAKRKARGLGTGSRIYRNFNQDNKRRNIDWQTGKHYWVWTGALFLRKLDSEPFVG
jgi:hypothetical protein